MEEEEEEEEVGESLFPHCFVHPSGIFRASQRNPVCIPDNVGGKSHFFFLVSPDMRFFFGGILTDDFFLNVSCVVWFLVLPGILR